MSGFLVVAAATLLVAAASGAGTALLHPRGRLDAAVTAGVLAAALALGAVLLAGAVGALRPGVLVAVHAVQAAAFIALALRRGWRPRRPALISRREVRRAPWAAALVALAAGGLLWQLLVALVLPPYAYDALSYHLPAVAHWVQTGGLSSDPLSACCAYYALNADLLLAWPVALLGSDTLVGLVQLLAAVQCGLAAAGIARTVGASRAGAAACGALVVCTPALLAQAPTAYVDVIVTALVLSGLHGLARFAVTARLLDLAVPAVCAGLLSGTKGLGPLWAVTLVATAAIVAALLVRRGRLATRPAAGAVGGVVVVCLVLGAWWYVRSAVETGNPLYPLRVELAGRVLADGPLTAEEILTPPERGSAYPAPVAVALSWASDLLPWRQLPYDYQQRSGGLGPLWPLLGLPLLVVAAVRWWRTRSSALVVLLPVLAVLLVQPYRWWSRFTLPLALLGALAVVLAVERARPGPRRLLQGTAGALAALGVALVVVAVNPASRAEPLPATRLLGLVGAPAQERSLGRAFLPEYRFLESVPDDATIVYDVRADPVRFGYPLFGAGLRRTVVPLGDRPPPDDAWVVTSTDRPVARDLARRRGAAFSDVRDVLVWAPRTAGALQ
jgi:hypothetical protein